MFKQFTLGIEEEFQIVDPHTRELRSHVSEILEEDKMLLGEQVKPEMIQSMIEVGTGICKDIKEARSDHHKPARYRFWSGAQEGVGDCRCRHSSVLALAGSEDLRKCEI